MLFSSVLFIFLFLPLVLGIYHLAPQRFRNHALLAMGFLFYFWTEGGYLLVLIASLLFNYAAALFLNKVGLGRRRDKAILWIAVAFNCGLLVSFKYLGFFAGQFSFLEKMTGQAWTVPHIYLPLGISFFTFKGLSYLIDVYRGDVAAERNIARYALYQSFFPQLLAGPIARFRDMKAQVAARSVTLQGFWSGAERFIVGLGKKTLVANQLGPVADQVFGMPSSHLSCTAAWLGIICYTLQIYFDFSGYTDMAIGLGRMFGFSTPENFNYPYISKSIREFWRRWHITLSEWFRDYLYIPLGGSRQGPSRTYFNIIVVFLLCGLWHGANWTFVIWGLWHGLFLVFERTSPGKRIVAIKGINHLYTCLAFTLGWVLFRSPDLTQAASYFQALFGFNGSAQVQSFWSLMNLKVASLVAAGAIGTTPLARDWMHRATARIHGKPLLAGIGQGAYLAILFILFIVSLSASAFDVHKAFIYFQF